MFDAKDTQWSVWSCRISTQIKDGALSLSEVCEVDIDGDHATKYWLVRVGSWLVDGAVEILCAVKRMRLHPARGQKCNDIIGEETCCHRRRQRIGACAQLRQIITLIKLP